MGKSQQTDEDSELGCFVFGIIIGIIFAFVLYAILENVDENACEKKYDVYDCERQPGAYKPSKKGLKQ